MEWEKAKNIVVFFLILLNVFLLSLVLKIDNKDTLTNKEEIAIKNILKENNITYNKNIEKKFKPKFSILINHYNIKNNDLLNTFFLNLNKVTINTETDNTIYKDDFGTLYIGKNEFSFISSKNESDFIFKKENALNICNEIIKNLGTDFSNFTFDTYYEVGNKEALIYFRDNFENYMINSNYLRFIINEHGLVQLSAEYYNPLIFTKRKMEICSVNEALITFIQFTTIEYKSKPLEIETIDLVYNIGPTNKSEFIPYYRIILKEYEEPFLINAFLNTMEIKK